MFVENAYLSCCCKMNCYVVGEGSLDLFGCSVDASGDVVGSGVRVLFPGGLM